MHNGLFFKRVRDFLHSWNRQKVHSNGDFIFILLWTYCNCTSSDLTRMENRKYLTYELSILSSGSTKYIGMLRSPLLFSFFLHEKFVYLNLFVYPALVSSIFTRMTLNPIASSLPRLPACQSPLLSTAESPGLSKHAMSSVCLIGTGNQCQVTPYAQK